MDNKNKIKELYKSHYDIINGDGIHYEYLISHLLQSKILISQVIDMKTGINLNESEYTIMRNSDNTIIIKFKNIPKKDESYCIMLLKIG